MGSYENIVKIEEIKRKVDEGDLLSAQRVLDTMEIKRIKNMADLNLIAEVYAENEKYEEAVDLYLKIFEKVKSRKALFQLIEILIKLNNSDDAEYYLRQYQKIAPKDFYNYVFRYKIDKIKGESFEHLIEILEELKKLEYTEKWAYELAKLYYKAGLDEECIRECSDIELWFGEGTYVEKARILRSTYSKEADKEGIMEEIRRRAEVMSSQTEEKDPSREEEIVTYATDLEEDIQYDTEPSDDNEGEIYSGTDFMVHEDAEDFVDGLKKDVQNIMVNEQPEDTSYYDYEDEVLTSDNDDSRQEEKTYFEKEIEIAREKAEQEVENTIYQLLKEENQDEEDLKLKQLMKVLQVDEEELFGNFLHVLSVKKQLVKILETIMNDRSNNMMLMITGSEGSGKTTLAKDIALFFYKAGKLKSSSLAKISAEKLNTVDISTKKDVLRDCCLVIEKASELKRATIDSLLMLSGQLHGNMAIIFEEDKKNINKLFREYPKLMDLLKNRIHIPQYTTEELMGFAYACLKQKEYILDKKAETVLQGKINQIIKQAELNKQLEQINALIQSAMNAADIRMGKQLSALASQGRLKDVEAATVIKEDFNIKP